MLLLLLILPALVASKCPLNWVQFGDLCYFYSPMVANWNAAEQMCQARGGHLASIHSKAQNDFIINQVINGGILNTTYWPYAYIGGFWNASVRKWQWTDGTPMNFTHFDTIVVPVIPASNTDHQSIRIHTSGYWLFEQDNLGNYAEGFVCQVPACDANGKSAASILSQNATDLWLAYLPNVNSWFYGCPNCFARSYLNSVAEIQCQSIGAHLPSVSNAFQNSELLAAYGKICSQENKDVSYSNFVFGLVSNATGYDWKFTDGTPLTYDKWGINEPKIFSHTAYSWISGNDGTWYTEYHSQRSFGCQIKINENLCQ